MHQKKLWKPKKIGRLRQNRVHSSFLIVLNFIFEQLSPIMNICHFNEKVGDLV